MAGKVRSLDLLFSPPDSMPALMGRSFTGTPWALRNIAETMGANPVLLFDGLSAQTQKAVISGKMIEQARKSAQS